MSMTQRRDRTYDRYPTSVEIAYHSGSLPFEKPFIGTSPFGLEAVLCTTIVILLCTVRRLIFLMFNNADMHPLCPWCRSIFLSFHKDDLHLLCSTRRTPIWYHCSFGFLFCPQGAYPLKVLILSWGVCLFGSSSLSPSLLPPTIGLKKSL